MNRCSDCGTLGRSGVFPAVVVVAYRLGGSGYHRFLCLGCLAKRRLRGERWTR